MDSSVLIQSPPMRKISQSSLQFRQLIQSLRNNSKYKKDVHNETAPIPPKKETEQIEESTNFHSEQKTSSQNNNFLLNNQSESRLRVKPKLLIGDRDKLKKKHLIVDNNPEVQQNLSKDISKQRFEVSLKIEDTSSKELIHLEMSPKKNASTQYDGFQLNQFSRVSSPKNNVKCGQIIKQLIHYEEPKEAEIVQDKKIRDINETIVKEYLERENRMNEKSDPSQIFNFFTNLCLSCNILIKSPSIKKYKNCVYFGFPINQFIYEGFLYFYDRKIYYGEFSKGVKHGLGVELNLNESSTLKGEFKEGHKTGKFFVDKPKEKYIGFLEDGIYQGEGRLTTQDYVYEGLFERGEKSGYGEEFYPKTGVKITGLFRNGVLERSKQSKSIPQIKNKVKVTPSKERLEHIRRKSLDKHNQRMNKIRNPTDRQAQFQIQFETQNEYQEPSKLNINPSKLQMYRQPPQKLPKICQQLQYSFENGKNFESISSHHETHRRAFSRSRRQGILESERIGQGQRKGTTQFEQPLPAPCLTVYKRR